jgi:hypothetical protein
MWQSARSKLSVVKFLFVLWISNEPDDAVEDCELVHFSILRTCIWVYFLAELNFQSLAADIEELYAYNWV